MSFLEVKLNRVDRIYRPGDNVSGVVVVDTTKSQGFSYSALNMKVQGEINLKQMAGSVGVFEAFFSNIAPVTVVDLEFEVAKAGSVPKGVTEIPFEFELLPVRGQRRLYETYHGVDVNTIYTIGVECVRGILSKNLKREVEFIVEVPDASSESADPKPLDFVISHETLENVSASELAAVPKFRITGKLHRTVCRVHLPFTGELVVEMSEAPIKSIHLLLVRVETVRGEANEASEATEIQDIQIADGDVCRNMVLPLYAILPRLFTCPTVDTKTFNIGFRVHLVVVFEDGGGDDYMVTESFPIKLMR